jgi:hypothetical protein
MIKTHWGRPHERSIQNKADPDSKKASLDDAIGKRISFFRFTLYVLRVTGFGRTYDF